jgi:hypothetical protein
LSRKRIRRSFTCGFVKTNLDKWLDKPNRFVLAYGASRSVSCDSVETGLDKPLRQTALAVCLGAQRLRGLSRQTDVTLCGRNGVACTGTVWRAWVATIWGNVRLDWYVLDGVWLSQAAQA